MTTSQSAFGYQPPDNKGQHLSQCHRLRRLHILFTTDMLVKGGSGERDRVGVVPAMNELVIGGLSMIRVVDPAGQENMIFSNMEGRTVDQRQLNLQTSGSTALNNLISFDRRNKGRGQ